MVYAAVDILYHSQQTRCNAHSHTHDVNHDNYGRSSGFNFDGRACIPSHGPDVTNSPTVIYIVVKKHLYYFLSPEGVSTPLYYSGIGLCDDGELQRMGIRTLSTTIAMLWLLYFAHSWWGPCTTRPQLIKTQWKPCWLATHLNPQWQWLGWGNCEWSMTSEVWRVKDDEWRMTSEVWRIYILYSYRPDYFLSSKAQIEHKLETLTNRNIMPDWWEIQKVRPKQEKSLFPVAKPPPPQKKNLTQSVGLFFLFWIIFCLFFTSIGSDEHTRYACSDTSLHAAHNKITDSDGGTAILIKNYWK